MNEIKVEALLPAVLGASKPYPQRSLIEAELVYGPELTTPSHSLQYLMRGSHPASDVVRWWQANQMVSSGTTPAGTAAGFGDRYGKWANKIKELDEQYNEGPLDEIMSYHSLVSASSSLETDVSPLPMHCVVPPTSRRVYEGIRRSETGTIEHLFSSSCSSWPNLTSYSDQIFPSIELISPCPPVSTRTTETMYCSILPLSIPPLHCSAMRAVALNQE
jgi:hypothetical protein